MTLAKLVVGAHHTVFLTSGGWVFGCGEAPAADRALFPTVVRSLRDHFVDDVFVANSALVCVTTEDRVFALGRNVRVNRRGYLDSSKMPVEIESLAGAGLHDCVVAGDKAYFR